MPTHLLLHKFRFKIVGPVPDEDVGKAESFFRRSGFKVTRVSTPPSISLVKRWEEKGVGRTTDGCWSKGLQSCRHGYRAWIAIFKEMG